MLLWVMDEADAFETSQGESNAEKCFNTLKTSASTRFGSRYTGLIIS